MKLNTSFTALATLILGLLSSPVQAIQEGDWMVRIGASNVDSNVSSTFFSGAPTVALDVDSSARPSLTISHMLQNNIALELLLATPFSHDIVASAGVGKVAETKQLPPTFSVQYHFAPQSKIRPYAGIGINFTNFFDTTPTATITSIDLDDSWGMAAQIGMDYDIGNDWFINVDLRYIDIETKGYTDIGTIDVEINPTVLTVAAGFSF